MKMNKKQKAQVVIAVLALALIVFWLFSPGWEASKILGIIANALIITSMLISYLAEEKKKKE